MKKLFLLVSLLLFLASCGSSRKASNSVAKGTPTTSVSGKKVNKIISYAKTFEGTRYKFGGTSSSGMDCSGLVYTAFKKEEIALPRVSRDMAKRGKRISLAQVAKGDLVFFQTNKNKNVINHVGLVVEAKGTTIRFIHSTSSRGVIISSLDERYWKSAFKEVRRVI